MHRLCRINIEESQGISETIKTKISLLADKIRSERNVDRIILYGSFARGDFNEGSDIDLVIVADFRERFHKRFLEIADITDLPVEAVCYTKEEFGDLIRNKNSFILSVLEEGISI